MQATLLNTEKRIRRVLTTASLASLASGATLALAYFAGFDPTRLVTDGLGLKNALYTAAGTLYGGSLAAYATMAPRLIRLEKAAKLSSGAFGHTRRGFGFLIAAAAPILGLPIGATLANEVMPVVHHNQDNARIVYMVGATFAMASFSLWVSTGRRFLSISMAQEYERRFGEVMLDHDRMIGQITGSPVRRLPVERNRFKTPKPKP